LPNDAGLQKTDNTSQAAQEKGRHPCGWPLIR
jgi:hypothetical protein